MAKRQIDIDTAVYYVRQCLNQNPAAKDELIKALNEELHDAEENAPVDQIERKVLKSMKKTTRFLLLRK